MRGILHIFAILVLSLLQAAAAKAEPVDVRITAQDPVSSDLALRDTLSVRLAYKSSVPVRFQAKGLLKDKPVISGAMYNIAPLYPAGAGEAIVWIAYRTPSVIDEVSIEVMGADWKPISLISLPVHVGWSGSLARRQQAEWVGRLNAVQQSMANDAVAATPNHESNGFGILLLLMPVGLLGYFILQPWTLMRFRGGWRVAALAPLAATAPLLVHAMLALAAGANLWPLLVIFGLPLATLYLAALSGVHALVRYSAA